MNLFPEPEQRDASSLVRSTAKPAPAPPEIQRTQRRGFFRAIGAFLGMCRDYSVEDLRRLQEAGIVIVEGKAAQQDGEAKVKVATAAKLHAEADAVKQDAATRRLQAEAEAFAKVTDAKLRLAEFQLKQKQQEVMDQELMDAAAERLAAAVATVVQKGGQVAFDSEQLLELLKQGRTEFPGDRLLKDAEPKLLESSDEPRSSA